MKLIIGLGNPGEKYGKTRHNLGFMVVEKFLKDFKSVENTTWENSTKFKSEISQIEWQPKHGNLEKVTLVKPKTYMNNSGLAVKIIADFYKISPDHVWIVRMGVGVQSSKFTHSASSGQKSKLKNVEDFVLSDFTGSECGKLKHLIKRGVQAIENSLEEGLEAAMNRFNTK